MNGFNKTSGNAVMNVPKCISEKYNGEEGTYIDKDWDKTVSSYESLLLADNSGGFESWVVLISLDKEVRCSKLMRTAKGLISLSFGCGVKVVK